MELFNIIEPTANRVPIIISSPHSGTYFPPDISGRLKPEMTANPDDTDWFIDQLYDFAPSLGITMIASNYSRWVIDLNRDPQSKPLYTDGRVITGLVPNTNFNGAALYRHETPDANEIEDRISRYYDPYHKKIASLLHETRTTFGIALLFDAHSIRKMVPGIQPDAFPDLILGDNDNTSASKNIIGAALEMLNKDTYQVTHNQPFKGGHITRYFGRPQNNIHALQLEMAKTNYMDDSETRYDHTRANRMRSLLKNLFMNLINTMQS